MLLHGYSDAFKFEPLFSKFSLLIHAPPKPLKVWSKTCGDAYSKGLAKWFRETTRVVSRLAQSSDSLLKHIMGGRVFQANSSDLYVGYRLSYYIFN